MDVGDGDMQEDPRPTRARPDALRGWVFLSMLAPDSTRDGDLRTSLEQPILVCREETRRDHQSAMAGVQPTPRHISLDLAPGADCNLHHLAATIMIKPLHRGHNSFLSRTLCLSFLCVAKNGFCHIRLPRRSKGRPDSLVNAILLQRPWSGLVLLLADAMSALLPPLPPPEILAWAVPVFLDCPTCRQNLLPDLPEKRRENHPPPLPEPARAVATLGLHFPDTTF